MNFENGPALVQSIARMLNRTDIDQDIIGFIRLAEKDLNMVLRTHEMIAKDTATFDTPFRTIPTSFIEMQSVNINTGLGPKALQYLPNEELDDKRRNILFGFHPIEPTHFQIVGNIMEIAPFTAPVEVEMRYFQKIPKLNLVDASAPDATNWLLEKSPNAYFYSALIHSALFLMEDERAQGWTDMARAAIESLNTAARAASQAGSRLNITTKTFG